MILEEYQKLLEKLKMLGDRAFVMSHIRVGLRKKAVDQVLRQPKKFDGIEAYLFVRFELEGDTWNYVKLNDGALEIIDVTEEEAWKQAYANVCSEVRIRPLFEHLQELAIERGMDIEEEEVEDVKGLYIVTNEQGWYGASSVLAGEQMDRFADEQGHKRWIVIPSSVHEVLLYPFMDEGDMELMSLIVREVNSENVAPEERLSDRAYVARFGKEGRNAEGS